MNWLNLETRTRTCPEFIGAEPEQRATWLCLMLYCAEHETGGVIRDCSAWGDRRWMQTIGCTKAEAHASCELWAWTGANLRVWGYPVEKEAEVAAMRAGGKRGGKRSGEARRKHSFEGGLQGGLERKGKEGKGIGKEDTLSPRARAGACEVDEFLQTMVDAVRGCRPEYAEINAMHLEQVLAACKDRGKLAGAVREWVADHANALKPYDMPLASIRKMVARAAGHEEPAPMTALQRRDAEQRRIAAGARG